MNDEYLNTLRSKSNADFFANAPSSFAVTDSSSFRHSSAPLDPGRLEASIAVLQSAHLSGNLKSLMLEYFDISDEASRICSLLLAGIHHIQSNHRSIPTDERSQPHLIESIRLHLASIAILDIHRNSPLSEPEDFVAVRERCSSVLRRLRTKSKQVARKIRLIGWIKNATGLVLAARGLSVLVMAPPILGIPARGLWRGWAKLPLGYEGALGRVGEQLEAAAKGAYILNREFETIGRLVRRLREEVEHGEGMVERCVDMRRKEEEEGVVAKELRKSEAGLREHVGELEEHVYLCIVTINRARAMVAKAAAAPAAPPTTASCD